MKNILFFVLTFTVAGFACSPVKNTETSMDTIVTQGITGRITEATGNQMPMQGAAPQVPKGILTKVLIYEPTHISQVSRTGTSPVYTEIRTKQVASVTTDSTGHFTVSLPVGSYSVFIQRGKEFYANLFDSANNIALFTVEENKLTTANLTVSISARY
jgi:hypothetical protein